MYLVGR